MSTRLDGKIALVTGGGQGVGQGIAFALASAGANVAIMGRTQSKIDQSLNQITERGGKGLGICGDVCALDDLTRAVEEVKNSYGGIDIVVNNAQQVPMGNLATVSDEAFQAGFQSGPLAAFRLMKIVHPIMAQRGGGIIFNLVSSAAIRWDMEGYGAYGAVKQAMRPLTRAAAAEWGKDGIRVLSIAPHANSPSLKWWINKHPEEAEKFFQSIPLKRIGDCENDIGQAVVALCAPEMGYLTGATIPLDGGQANFD